MMKKTMNSREVTSLNRAVFRLSPGDLAGGELLDELLSQVLGGFSEPSINAACTEFSCTLYAPPPPSA